MRATNRVVGGKGYVSVAILLSSLFASAGLAGAVVPDRGAATIWYVDNDTRPPRSGMARSLRRFVAFRTGSTRRRTAMRWWWHREHTWRAAICSARNLYSVVRVDVTSPR